MIKGNSVYRFWRFCVLVLLTGFMLACSDPDSSTSKNKEETLQAMVGKEFALSVQGLADTNTSATNDSVLFIEIQWSIISKPPNSRATIANPTSTSPSFRPDIAGEYVLKVVIYQGGEVLTEKEITIIAGVDDLFPPKPDNHIPTTDDCMACHLPDTWLIPTVDHNQVLVPCAVCHDGIRATGQKQGHIPTNEQCDFCHRTDTWLPAIPDHQAVVGRCVECHNGVVASGKSQLHPTTTDICEACHYIFPNMWVPVIVPMDHSQVVGICESCHSPNGVASYKSPTHVPTTEDCGFCHLTPPANWLGVIFDPTLPPPDPNLPPPDPNQPPPVPTQPDPNRPPYVDHATFTGNCVSCHNGVTASGKSPNHVPSSDTCDLCHATPPATWLTVLGPVDHSQFVGACVDCHTNKSPLHIATSDLCEACHNTAFWVPALLVDHSQVLGLCSDCHDGVIATGLSVTHVAVNVDCGACHVPGDWFTIVTPVP